MRKAVKKIFGIALALALVLSMGVMATPVAAQGTITCQGVTLTNPLTGQLSDYVINFTTQEPVAVGEYIDVTFPPTTTLALIGTSDVLVQGYDAAAVYQSYTVSGANLAAAIFGTTLRITLLTGNLVAGAIGVVITDIVTNGVQCSQTLCVGTTAETCEDCPPYNIFLVKCELRAGWNLISLPCIPDDPDIRVVLANLIARAQDCCQPTFTFKVYYYDCTTWYAFNNGSYASLTQMTECRGYWIWVSEDISFYLKCEYYPEPPGPPLKKCYHECWNMVGFTSNVPREPFDNTGAACAVGLSAYMDGLSPPDTVIYILGWDAGLQDWYAVVQAPAVGVNCLVPCQGYWMAFSQDACFAPPPPGV